MLIFRTKNIYLLRITESQCVVTITAGQAEHWAYLRPQLAVAEWSAIFWHPTTCYTVRQQQCRHAGRSPVVDLMQNKLPS